MVRQFRKRVCAQRKGKRQKFNKVVEKLTREICAKLGIVNDRTISVEALMAEAEKILKKE